MPKLKQPGVYIEEVSQLPPTIAGVPTSVAAFIGRTSRGPRRPLRVTSLIDYQRWFGSGGPYLPAAIAGYFGNGGREAWVCRLTPRHDLAACLRDLETEACREVAMVAAPGLTDAGTAAALIAHGEAVGHFVMLDPPRGDPAAFDPRAAHPSNDAACHAPWLTTSSGVVPPSGHVLGAYARSDEQRGVWKAPANQPLKGVTGAEQELDEEDQAALNQRGVNLIRSIEGRGTMIWGARTLSTDALWKYVSVRRLFLYLRRSIEEGTRWAVFEPNDLSLWRKVRGSIENFLTIVWRQGGFAGDRPERAFYVRCDRTTMTQDDIDNGRIVVEIGIAPVRPAEFVIFRIGQWTADRDPDDEKFSRPARPSRRRSGP